ncbi:polysaccharide biosynthesis/export family protein [Roseovarius sp. PS-C2]|uniref:polysaccharide biosynthesis/export family protein n=1 Tax=Roseovarius sp. PS-C2 TaxID=2820814 RepID=UPI00209B206A|nr:polysaccharide biosynthesis/export family protein [Roseovarius sp. PS-C2]
MKVKDLPMLAIIRSFFIFAAAMIAATGAFAQGAYQIKSGDALQIEVLEDPNLNRTVLVLPDGSFNFPLIGSIQAGGKSLSSVRSALSSGLASNFNTPPTVFVSIAALGPAPVAAPAVPVAPPTIDIFVMGEVAAPGKLAASPEITILQALAQAGGLTRFAARKRVELRRADSETGVITRYRYNYDGTGKSIKGSTLLIPGDVIVVPARRLFE